ncbi:MAG: nitrous oxide-stimulated promoter family protein [Bacteroidales bacterium]|nr:nitrous oxide-stimulated promoter family protein [Bacteroidales bacterium]MDD4067824.1 nitrous oxide-stimulated promoter family protein [Bacteroidales bacterium]MDD4739225.1 nitrous oxide-stimulated promoter family protein [Bacteroidales bacterium]
MANIIEKEKRIMELMVRLYCSKKEKNNELCDSCKELIKYSKKRLEHCPHGERKPSCKRCQKHCYRKEYREEIRKVMRYSGPRIILYKPLEFIRHLVK